LLLYLFSVLASTLLLTSFANYLLSIKIFFLADDEACKIYMLGAAESLRFTELAVV
jgi:hypothetical protein